MVTCMDKATNNLPAVVIPNHRPALSLPMPNRIPMVILQVHLKHQAAAEIGTLTTCPKALPNLPPPLANKASTPAKVPTS
mmetsp:Transcript_48019/g.58153  ORF Transcript_48019/g.58153 Transcript_48019/m.58153 type:complete len:80 (-) Transcript_48019:1313-1552(-)